MPLYIKGNRCSNLHVSCSSDQFDEDENFVGLVFWMYDGKTKFTINGHRMKIGYIIFKNSDALSDFDDEVY